MWGFLPHSQLVWFMARGESLLLVDSMAVLGNTPQPGCLPTSMQQEAIGVEGACPTLSQEIWERVAGHIGVGADRARCCMAFKGLCKPGYLKTCLLKHLVERYKLQRWIVVSPSAHHSGDLHAKPRLSAVLQAGLLQQYMRALATLQGPQTCQDAVPAQARLAELDAQVKLAQCALVCFDLAMSSQARLCRPFIASPFVLESVFDAAFSMLRA